MQSSSQFTRCDIGTWDCQDRKHQRGTTSTTLIGFSSSVVKSFNPDTLRVFMSSDTCPHCCLALATPTCDKPLKNKKCTERRRHTSPTTGEFPAMGGQHCSANILLHFLTRMTPSTWSMDGTMGASACFMMTGQKTRPRQPGIQKTYHCRASHCKDENHTLVANSCVLPPWSCKQLPATDFPKKGQ